MERRNNKTGETEGKRRKREKREREGGRRKDGDKI